MAKFTDYTEKTEPVDTDLALIYDTPAKVNKKFTFGNLWKWIAKKIVSEGISQLETTNKTLPGAINELNSNGVYLYSKENKSNTNPVTVELKSYSTYLLFVQHDGGINSMISAITAESNPKIIKITSSGNAFGVTLENKKLTITSTVTYWTYVIIKLS